MRGLYWSPKGDLHVGKGPVLLAYVAATGGPPALGSLASRPKTRLVSPCSTRRAVTYRDIIVILFGDEYATWGGQGRQDEAREGAHLVPLVIPLAEP